MDNLAITYFSFWDVELNNRLAGLLRKRVLSPAKAHDVLGAIRA